MSVVPDVLIVGAVRSVSRLRTSLRTTGQRVTILDRGEPGQESSWAGAGIVPPGDPDRVTEPLDRLRAESSAAFPKFAADIKEISGIDPGYRKSGAFYYDDEAEPLPFDENESAKASRMNPATRRRCINVSQRLSGSAGYFLPDVCRCAARV